MIAENSKICTKNFMSGFDDLIEDTYLNQYPYSLRKFIFNNDCLVIGTKKKGTGAGMHTIKHELMLSEPGSSDVWQFRKG